MPHAGQSGRILCRFPVSDRGSGGRNVAVDARGSVASESHRTESVDEQPAEEEEEEDGAGKSGDPALGPTPERIARARCLVPLLAHVTVRLASLAPVRIAIREICQRSSLDKMLPRGGRERSAHLSACPDREAFVAAFEAMAQADEVGCFAGELSELCGAEGQWLAALALAPQVTQKLSDSIRRLSKALDSACRCLESLGAVAVQPAAASPTTALQPAAAEAARVIVPGCTGSTAIDRFAEVQTELAKGALQTNDVASGSHASLDPSRHPEPIYSGCGSNASFERRAFAGLRAMLRSASAGLCADMDDEAFSNLITASEAETAVELQRWLLNCRPPCADARTLEERQTLLEKITAFEGTTSRPLSALSRELEAAEQFCRVLAGASAPGLGLAPVGRGGLAVESDRETGGGRDAPVSEAQASGGSALHRWIRQQVTDMQSRGGAGGRLPGGSAPSSGGGLGAAERRGGVGSFLKLADIPHEFLCPIAQDVMRDAVSTCDGHTYERRNIEAWLGERSTSPITGLPLANKTLIPNHNLRKLILDSGVLSRLEPDGASQDAQAPHFRDAPSFEVLVPGDAPSLSDALDIGRGRAEQLGGITPTGAPSGRVPTYCIRLLAGEHLVARTLQIDQDVEIVGQAVASTVVRLAVGVTLELRSRVHLASIALRREVIEPPSPSQRGSFGSGLRSTPLIEILRGNAFIEHCDLSNSLGSAFRVSGAHTSPTITRCTIHDCRDPSTIFQDGADGVFSANRLFRNRSVAIEIHSRADPLVEDNDVFDGSQGGVFVYNRGKGHLKRNKIFQNALEGVEIKQGGRPLVEDNDIYDNLECGIFIHSGGEGRIIGNRIHSNSYAGIEIKDASSPEVRGNDVYSGRTSGMYVHSSGQGVIEDNQIHQNMLHGIYVRNRGCPLLLKNRVFKNDECGIFVTESSHPCIERNEVYSNGLAGIEVKEESNPTIKLNRIHSGNTGGIFVLARGQGRIFENKLYKNRLEGVEIKDGGDPHVTDNEIYDNLECGVFAHDGALGKIEGNRIFGNAYAGIEIKDLSCPIVKRNRIYRGQTSGIYVHKGGQGKLVDNEVFENGLHGIMILSGGQPALSKNKVHDNIECGVVHHAGFALDSSSNQIWANRVKNIQAVRM